MSHPSHLQPLPDLDYLQQALITPGTRYPAVCLKFKAEWCGPCKRIDTRALLESNSHVQWFEVDADAHSDVLDYCNITTIPAFLAIKKGVPMPIFQSSNTNEVMAWLQQVFP